MLPPQRPPGQGRSRHPLTLPVQPPTHPHGTPVGSARTLIHSVISPRITPFSDGGRSPTHSSNIDRSPRTQTTRNNSDDATSANSNYVCTGAEDVEMEDEKSLKRLHIDDAYLSGSQRTRTISSEEECVPSSLPRAVTMPLVTTSTMSMPIHPPSITTGNSLDRQSHTNSLLGGTSPVSRCLSYAAPAFLNSNPLTSASIHSKTVSSADTPKFTEVQKPGGAKVQELCICKCCPKKPKRFNTLEELNAHEVEKKYECTFCGSRFKNKNEAERHQNSLHVRPYSWSCSALSRHDMAFHDSTEMPGEADTCGYCGDTFSRSGRDLSTGELTGENMLRHATDQDWEERIKHLQEIHKFRECNSSKKFFRADHFRQHLKHSHAGTSGKWTSMLEKACMSEEDSEPR
ncbi:hypothetical protein FOTG_16719 [Fusarium oxysporum f. sp. vasinfectum 25433]|uniref:C2H2-type domain-containing protein n=1 Tax=Fusarium oxysporum f. sp. vasinfectum 25433 TaxID=1089449 RepID=X0M2N2_FUSOX|nr:hypothetical protein FOTG_16719 [Fusarium oxysporum f. sp. vasinfectum 25433]